ncbi:hypothetical protein LCM08_06280 [Salipiger pacificus]|nr:hypothetical protein [Alloyangia pacifica]
MKAYRIEPGDPIVDQRGQRVIAKFARGVDLTPGATSYSWTWHRPTPGSVEPPEMIQGPDGPKPRNQATVHLDYAAAGFRIWRVSYLFGDADHAFDDALFMAPDAAPSATPAGMAAACNVLLGSGYLPPDLQASLAPYARHWEAMAQDAQRRKEGKRA